MVKTSVLVCIDSELMALAKEKLKGQVSRICNEAIRKELAIAEASPDELVELQKLIELKANVQRLATQDGGTTAVRVVAGNLRKEKGSPNSITEKVSFWSEVYRGAKLILIKEKVKGVSPAPLPQNTDESKP